MYFIVDVARPERPESIGVAVVYSTWISEDQRTCFLPSKNRDKLAKTKENPNEEWECWLLSNVSTPFGKKTSF
jgi:hypothetical protein